MTKLHMTRAQIELLLYPLRLGSRAGGAITNTTVVTLSARCPIALNGEQVELAPGLHGQVTSKDGCQVTVSASAVLTWLVLA